MKYFEFYSSIHDTFDPDFFCSTRLILLILERLSMTINKIKRVEQQNWSRLYHELNCKIHNISYQNIGWNLNAKLTRQTKKSWLHVSWIGLLNSKYFKIKSVRVACPVNKIVFESKRRYQEYNHIPYITYIIYDI